ncbi:S-layer homology domain-containing protein [Dysosmobacter sp.]|uniref:S-layer homology domain-containing protein n=1 Tax=Dysosmobacter sp. TaxID=2591382 RepID=UPI00406DB45B
MKKRILSILLLCCMVLTLLPTTAFAADELPDVKLSIPTTFDKTVYLTNQKKELKITDSKTYLIKGSADPNWYFQYRIKIDGGRKKITPHIFLDGVRLQAPKDGPAIELYGGASACLYFIGNDSELIGAENFAALQKNKTDGHLRVLVQTGTKLTCEGGRYGAGIGGSKVGIKKFSQGHGMNLHFGSLATDIYGGEILATSGVYGAGIGGGQGGVGEQIYVYSGKLMVRSVSEGAGIGGGQGGPGRFIYIKGGTVNAGSESGGAGIGSGDQDGQNKSEDAHHIEISGGTVEAWSNYAGAGIGGGRDGSGYDISITGGVVRAQGYFGAGIGGGMNGNSGNILIKDTTLTALALPLYSSPDYTALSASAVGRGSNRVHYQVVMQDQEFAMSIEENIKIGASNGKSVWLSATGWQWRHNQEPKKYWYWDTTTELLIPNENGRVDLQRLSLPYAYNYGRVISKLELRCEESTCSHEFGWAIRDDCHIWACMKCGARDPAAEMSKQNGKHIPGDWSNQKQLCTVCDHVLERDTKAPVMETLTDGESYTVEDTLDGKPGAYTFTVIDPAASGETSSGVKSVTINGVEQDGPTYRLPAPDGGNNDAGAEYTVVATDNAGNETTATVRTYRRHHEHSYGDWSKDGTSHWHECADADCPNRNESIKDKAAHVYTDDADTTCNVCGYERTVAPPAPTEFIVTFDGNGGTGSMEPVTVEEGSRYVLPACGFTAPDGQEFKAWEIGGVEYNAGDGYVVLGNTEIKALWKDSAVIPTTFTITFNANGGTGSMEPVTVEEGSRYPLPACGFIPPVNMQFSGWALSAGGSVIADGAIMVTSNITLYAIWEPVPVNEFVIFFDGNGGTPAVSSMTTIGHKLAFLPGAFRSGSYRFDGWYTERNGGELIATSTVFAANTIVYAHWTYTGGSGGSGGYVPGYYIIRATAGAGGSITPSGDVSVRAGANQTFTITPNRGYAVSDVKIDGRSIGAVRSYTFENISASHTIEVQFRVRSSFVDVPSGSYYEDAVDWAVANGITTGTDAAHFSPDGICTRAQAVTFLWRAAGRPAPESRTMPFTDVPADSYYYDAVLWAVENGITKGTSSTTFSPDDTCTRAQIVTFLWRSEQSPAAGSSNPFTDVSADAYYADAVLWAVKEAITTGTTRTTFSPDAECTRAQIVTFLWRCKK